MNDANVYSSEVKKNNSFCLFYFGDLEPSHSHDTKLCMFSHCSIIISNFVVWSLLRVYICFLFLGSLLITKFLSTGSKIVPCFYPSVFGKWMVLAIHGPFYFLMQQLLFYGKILVEDDY